MGRIGIEEGNQREEGLYLSLTVSVLTLHTHTPLPGIETELLVDYYLTPGASWSLLKKGEKVKVLARMASGWYRCIAMRDADCQLDPDPCSSSMVCALDWREGRGEGRDRERKGGREGGSEGGRVGTERKGGRE